MSQDDGALPSAHGPVQQLRGLSGSQHDTGPRGSTCFPMGPSHLVTFTQMKLMVPGTGSIQSDKGTKKDKLPDHPACSAAPAKSALPLP